MNIQFAPMIIVGILIAWQVKEKKLEKRREDHEAEMTPVTSEKIGARATEVAVKPAKTFGHLGQFRHGCVDGNVKGENMKLSFCVFIVLIALPVCADIPSPMPLHRIGFEVLVYVAGAAALGGGFIWKIKKKLDEADCWKTDDEISYHEKEDALRRICQSGLNRTRGEIRLAQILHRIWSTDGVVMYGENYSKNC